MFTLFAAAITFTIALFLLITGLVSLFKAQFPFLNRLNAREFRYGSTGKRLVGLSLSISALIMLFGLAYPFLTADFAAPWLKSISNGIQAAGGILMLATFSLVKFP